MTNLDSILKSRDITLPTKAHVVKAVVYPVVMYGCESWSIKKAECWRIDAFDLWCWRRCLRVPWTARRSNQFILKEINLNIHWKDWCWSWNSQYFGYLMWRTDWLEKGLMLGKIEGRRRRRHQSDRGWGGWMASPTQNMSLSKLWELVIAWCAAVHGVAKSRTRLSDWAELNCPFLSSYVLFTLDLETRYWNLKRIAG